MKKLPLLLALSLAANAAFLVTLFLHPAPTRNAAATAPAAKSGVAAVASPGSSTASAGETPPTAQELAAIRVFRKLQAASKAMQAKASPDSRYWQRSGSMGLPSREEMAEMSRVRREFADAMRAAFGPDATLGVLGNSRFNFLPTSKQEQLGRILQDYGELQAEIFRDTNGIQLPTDRAKLKLLREEQGKDIAALLSPQELEQYELRASRTADTIRSRFGAAIETEDDYRKIFALQKAFDASFPMEDLMGNRPSQDYFRQRSEAERQLQGQIQAALGDEKYAAFKRASDQEYQALTSLTSRLNLPPAAPNAVLATRDSYAAESQRIQADASLSPQDRRTQIQALAERAKGQVAATLGSEAAAAYAPRAQWMNYLNSGIAFSTNPKDAPASMGGLGNSSVYPVMPPGTRTSTNSVSSQTVIIRDGSGGTLNLSGGTLNLPVSVSTSTSTTAPAAPAPAAPAPPGKP